MPEFNPAELQLSDSKTLLKILDIDKWQKAITAKLYAIIESDWGKDKLRSICKEAFIAKEGLDLDNKKQVMLLQVLAHTFGLAVYIDGLYWRQTKEALSTILKLNSWLEPPIISLPTNIDEKKLAWYRTWKSEDEAILSLQASFEKKYPDEEAVKRFEKEITNYKLDIQAMKLGSTQIKTWEKDDSWSLEDDEMWSGSKKIKKKESKDSKEWKESTELVKFIEKTTHDIFIMSTIETTYNQKERMIYIMDAGNPDSPIVVSLDIIESNKWDMKLEDAITATLENAQRILESFEMPAWWDKKGEWQLSAKKMIDLWSEKRPLDIAEKMKIQKLKNIIKSIDRLDIKEEYKVNLINKYLSDGGDVSSRLNDVIHTLQKMESILGSIPDEIQRKFIKNIIIDKHIEEFTLFKRNPRQFLDWLTSVFWWDMRWDNIKDSVDDEYFNKINEIYKINFDLADSVFSKQRVNSGNLNWSVNSKIVVENISFIREYSSFLTSEKIESASWIEKEFLKASKAWLDKMVLADRIESAKEYLYNLKATPILDNPILVSLKKLEWNNKDLYEQIRPTIILDLQEWKLPFDYIMSIIENAENVNSNINDISKNISNAHIKKKLDILKESIFKWDYGQNILEKVKLLDKKISAINSEQGAWFLENTLKINSLINRAFMWELDLAALADNLEVISHLPIADSPEIYKELIKASLEKGGYFTTSKTPYSEIMSYYVKVINRLKDWKYDFMSKEQQSWLIHTIAKGDISEARFDSMLRQLDKMKTKIKSWEMKTEDAVKMVDAMMTDKISLNGDKQTEELSKDEEAILRDWTESLKQSKVTIAKLEKAIASPRVSLVQKEQLKKKLEEIRNDANELSYALELIQNKTNSKKKMSSDTADFLLGDYSDKTKADKWHKMPIEIFGNEEAGKEYDKLLGDAMMNGELSSRDVEYVVGTLFNPSSPQYALLKTLSQHDRQIFLNNIATWVVSYEPELCMIDKEKWVKKKTLSQKVDFILNNFKRLDELNTIPDWVNKVKYSKNIPNIRASFFGGYLASEEALSFKLRTYKSWVLDNMISDWNNWEIVQSLYVYYKTKDPAKLQNI